MGHRTTKTNHKAKVHKTVSCRIDFFYYAFRNVLLVSIPLLVVCSIVLSHLSFHSSAYSSSTDSVSLSLPTSCTISANVLTPHNATLVNGQYEGNIGNTRINAYCNDNNGYFIYAIGSSNGTDGNTDLVSSINDNYNIHTNIYNSSTITANTPSSWAMKLTGSNGTYAPTIVDGYSNYNLIPSTDTIVAYRTSGTSMDLDTDLTGSYFNTTYEIYTNPIQPAGTYLGKVKYTMTHPYDASQLTTMEEAFDIAGKDKVQATDPITGETGDYYKMQDMSSRICSLTTAYEIEEKLVDIRDSKIYYVSKLKDGHCWMTQNLDLDLDPAKPLTSNDTDLTDHSLTGAYADGYNYDINTGIATWTPNSKTIDFAGRTLSGWGINNTTPRSANKTDSTETGHTSLGNYYNWTAAIASSNSTSLSTNYTIANNSICPKGWRLPIATNSDQSIYEFGDLLFKQDVTTSKVGNQLSYTPNGYSNIRNNPLYLTQFGLIYNDNLNNASGGGLYWSSATMSSTDAYYLYFNSSGVWPVHHNNYFGKNNGWSIRCLAR